MKVKILFFHIATIFLISLVLPLVPVNASETVAEPRLMITEIKLGGDPAITFSDSNVARDFVEITNISDEAIDLSGWSLEYAKSDFDPLNCSAISWPELTQASLATSLFGQIGANSVSLPISRQLNDNQDGALRLIDSEGITHDLVGWGNLASCYETKPTATPSNGKSIQRLLDCDGVPMDTDNNFDDFAVNQVPTPGDVGNTFLGECIEDNEENNTEDEESENLVSSCEGVVISEVLPNPSGSDGGREFIEIHNPTNKSVALENCKLQTSSKSTLFVFSSEILKPKEYKALYDTDTSLNLANASGGTVWLLDHADVELDEVVYPADMDDDVSYAKFDNEWKSTYIPTPDEENILQATKPCPAGQYRSQETNRCRSSVLASSLLKPCRPDQKRNSETNRCRSTSLASTLKPCDPDQFRNPETNRCKKFDSGSTLKPCNPGQERNPETNRCKKVEDAVLGSSLDSVKDAPSPSVGNKVSWWFAGGTMVGAVGYAGFEWRKEFWAAINSIKLKFFGSSG